MTSKKLLHHLEIALRIASIGTTVVSILDIVCFQDDLEGACLCFERARLSERDQLVLLSMDQQDRRMAALRMRDRERPPSLKARVMAPDWGIAKTDTKHKCAGRHDRPGNDGNYPVQSIQE